MCGLSPLSNNQNTTFEVTWTTTRQMWLSTLLSHCHLGHFKIKLWGLLCHSGPTLKVKTLHSYTASGILTFTFLWDLVELVPGGTFTFKGSHCVDTVSSRTDARDGLALVHICTYRAYDQWTDTHTHTHTHITHWFLSFREEEKWHWGDKIHSDTDMNINTNLAEALVWINSVWGWVCLRRWSGYPH